MKTLIVHAPKDSEVNFNHGRQHGIWGFAEGNRVRTIKKGDRLVLSFQCIGGAPRVNSEAWRSYKLGHVVEGEITEAYFRSDTPEWPNESTNDIRYPHRVRFRILREERSVPVASLNAEIAEELRNSACNSGSAKIVENAGPLFISPQVEIPPSEVNFTTLMNAIIASIRCSGFQISDQTIRSFWASIRAKPFVILAGNSGTGKSRLVRLFAEACGATTDNGGFHLVAVRPDWSDGGELLGYLDLQNEFRPGLLLEPLLRAHAQPESPVFVCLDEMNLARVEHYFSDFLSKIESRRRLADGRVVSDAVISAGDLDLLKKANLPPELQETVGRLKTAKHGIHLPPNLIIVGTVNMDETTHAFSRKVLDRANTLEIEAGRLSGDLPSAAEPIPNLARAPIEAIDLTAPFLTARDMVNEPTHAEALKRVATLLDELNDILSEANLQVAYRTRDEAAAFFIHATAAGLSEDEAEHAIMMQKILPRVQGSSPRLALILEKLMLRFHPATSVRANSEELNSEKLNGELLKLRRNSTISPLVRKLASMWLVYLDDGFTSFWVA